MRTLLALAFSVLLAACTTTGEPISPIGNSSSVNPTTGELRQQPSLIVTPNAEVSAETLAGGALVYLVDAPATSMGFGGTVFTPAEAALLYIIYDPMAPNWTIKEKALNEETYYLSLRAKSFRTGGDGEAVQILKRRALQLQREKGYASYRILDYSEGIESSTPFTHRVSEGTVQLVRAQIPARQ